MRNRSIGRLVGIGLAAGGLTLGVLAGPVASGAVTAKASSTLRVAFTPTNNPNSDYPFYSADTCTTSNIDYWDLTTRPGYWFGLGGSVSYQSAMSPLATPTFTVAGGNTTAHIVVKGWNWTNGSGGTSKMDAADVMQWLNIDQAQSGAAAIGSGNGACGFVPNFGIPDEVVNATMPGGATGNTVDVTFQGTPNQTWLFDNELSQIVPLAPAWDSDAASGPGANGSAGCAAEAYNAVKTDGSDVCSKVFTYMNGLLMSNATWDWADGPYRQKSAGYNAGGADGNDVQVANTGYSGPASTAAHAVKTIKYTPESSTTTEIGQLQSNKLDLGFVDPPDLSTYHPGGSIKNLLPHMTSYKAEATNDYGVFYWMFNFDTKYATYNTCSSHCATATSGTGIPSWAALNNQPYFRAALQQSYSQPLIDLHVNNGYSIPTVSAVPLHPAASYTSGIANPYPYSTSKGKATMKAAGWNTKVFPAVCAKANCGSAAFPVAKNTKASESILIPSGDPTVKLQVTDEVAEIKAASDIQIKPIFKPATGYVQPACFGGAHPWELCGYGGWIFAPDYYPSGEVLFGLGASSNSGGYENGEMTALLHGTTDTGTYQLNQVQPTYSTSYAEYTAKDLPFLWQPTPVANIEVRSTIKGFPAPSPLTNFNPEYITAI